MNNKVLIIGTGAWGTAIASILLDNGIYVKMYGISQQEINDLKNGYNKKIFGNIKLTIPPHEVSTNVSSLMNDVKYIIFCVPTKNYDDVIKKISKYIKTDMILINTSKGLDGKISYHQKLTSSFKKNKVCSIIGPSFAKEVLLKKHTMINVVGQDKNTCSKLIKLFNNNYFKLSYCKDYIGSSVLSALKNILAIIMGILDESKLSINTKSAILTYAINEFGEIVKFFGGNRDSINELSGIGDIFLTCTNTLSRNYSFGIDLVKNNFKYSPNKSTIEGYQTLINMHKLFNTNKKQNIFNFINQSYKLITNKIDIRKFVDEIWKSL